MSAPILHRLAVRLDVVECIACWRRGGVLDVAARVVQHRDGTRCVLPARTDARGSS